MDSDSLLQLIALAQIPAFIKYTLFLLSFCQRYLSRIVENIRFRYGVLDFLLRQVYDG